MLCLLCLQRLTALTCLSRQLSIQTNLLHFVPVCPSPLWLFSPPSPSDSSGLTQCFIPLASKKLNDLPGLASPLLSLLLSSLPISLSIAVIFIPLSSGSKNRSSSRPISISRGPQQQNGKANMEIQSPRWTPLWHHSLTDIGFRRAVAMLIYWYTVILLKSLCDNFPGFLSTVMHFSPAYPMARHYLAGQVCTSKVVKEPDASSNEAYWIKILKGTNHQASPLCYRRYKVLNAILILVLWLILCSCK